MTDVAVVIGNYEGERFLQDALGSLAEQSLAPSEVLVADASSTDRSVAVAESLGASVLVQPNHGLGFLYNRGVESVDAELVLLLNNDVALDADCIRLLASALEADGSRFCADARQLDWAGERTIHARTVISPGRLLREYLPGLHLDHVVTAREVVPTVCANGAAMMVRRDLFLQLGGFDETFFMEWEDLDLCWRAWAYGWPSVYVPDAVVRHRVGAVTTDVIAPARSASSHHNLLRFAFKCLPWPVALKVALGELVRLPNHPKAIARGVSAVLLELREILRLRSELAGRRHAYETLVTGER